MTSATAVGVMLRPATAASTQYPIVHERSAPCTTFETLTCPTSRPP